VRFDAEAAGEVRVGAAPLVLTGDEQAGTHGRLALTPTDRLDVRWAPPPRRFERTPRLQLSGPVSWNLDAGRQQVAARLEVRIVGGRTDRLVLRLPAEARRVRVTGPDARETRAEGGRATVFLRGPVAERTRLDVQYELPAARQQATFAPPRIEGGRWSEGVLAITSTIGTSEVLPGAARGLRRIAPRELPPAAKALVAGEPVLAYEVTGGTFSATVELLALGEFALTETLADLGHFRLTLTRDGGVMVRARYEVRNRTRQFLRVALPAGAAVLTARVNDEAVTLAPDARGAYRLPLVRSRPSVEGLVSFPVELVYLCRAGRADEQTKLPLPTIDVPVAYAWCEAYVPRELDVARWAGPLRRVPHFSSEIAQAQLAYGRGELAEGYEPEERIRPETGEPPAQKDQEPPAQPKLGDAPDKPIAPGEPESKSALVPGPVAAPSRLPGIRGAGAPASEKGRAVADLAANYYRTGRKHYDKNEYDQAAKAFNQVLKLAPKSIEARNAERFLGNIRTMRGEQEARSGKMKAAAAAVRRERAEAGRELHQELERYTAGAKKAAEAGQLAKARLQAQAAERAAKQLQAQGQGQVVHGQLKEVQAALKATREQQRQRQTALRTELEARRKKGQYQAAVTVARRLAEESEGEAAAKARKEAERLAILAARQEAEQRQQAQRGLEARRARAAPRLQEKAPQQRHLEQTLEQLRSLPAQQARQSGQQAKAQRGHQRQLAARRQPVAGRQVQPRPQPSVAGSAPARAQSRDRLEAFASATRARQVNELTRWAKDLASQHKFDQAAELFERIVQLEPDNEASRQRLAWLRQSSELVKEGRWDDLQKRQEQKQFVDIRQAEVPWHELLRYPDDWKKLTMGREPAGAQRAAPAERDIDRVFGRETTVDRIEYEDGLRTRLGGANELVTKRYDIRDLTVSKSGEAAEGPAAAEEQRRQEKWIAEQIRTNVLPQSWSDKDDDGAPQTTVTAPRLTLSNGQLSVIQTLGGQRAVSGLLENLRAARGPNVEQGLNIARQQTAGGVQPQGGGGGGGAGTYGTVVNGVLPDGGVLRVGDGTFRIADGRAGSDGGWGPTGSGDAVHLDYGYAQGYRQPADRWTGATVQPSGGYMGYGSAERAGAGRLAFDDFIDRNYDWMLQGRTDSADEAALPPAEARALLARRLRQNWNQVVDVASVNLAVPAGDARNLGVEFRQGANDVTYAVIDAAQFRTLRQMEARRGPAFQAAGVAAPSNLLLGGQATVIGTEALLANGMTVNPTFGGDLYNGMDVRGNPIRLEHERYILIDNNDGTLTAVKAGAMRHWADVSARGAGLAAAPQEFEVPRVGRLVRLEKALLDAGEDLTIHATCTWKGDGK